MWHTVFWTGLDGDDTVEGAERRRGAGLLCLQSAEISQQINERFVVDD